LISHYHFKVLLEKYLGSHRVFLKDRQFSVFLADSWNLLYLLIYLFFVFI